MTFRCFYDEWLGCCCAVDRDVTAVRDAMRSAKSSDADLIRRGLEDKIRELERRLADRDEQIQELTSQLDKYRSVVPMPTAFGTVGSGSGSGGDGGGSQDAIVGSAAGPNGSTANGLPRKQRTHGVSAEPTPVQRNLHELERDTLRAYPKTQRSAELIKQAIQNNEFMKHLSSANIREIVDCMYSVEFKADTVIIKEGDVGSRVYVLEEGRVEVTKEGRKLCYKAPRTVLGELAILYNCTRTATVKAVDYCKLWAIDRHVFQAIMMKTELLRQRQCIEWLQCVPKMKGYAEDVIYRIVNAMEEVRYKSGEFIVRQGSRNDAMFVITKGKAREVRRQVGSKDDVIVRQLNQGNFFGDQALDDVEMRTTSVLVTDSDGAICLVLDRTTFNQLINAAPSSRQLAPTTAVAADTSTTSTRNGHQPQAPVDPLSAVRHISDFVVLATVGVGGFGRVELVRLKSDTAAGRTYALKQMKKFHIVETCQQEHIMNEKNIMSEAKSDFIVRLYKTFKDSKYLYMVLEACLGGELWTLLRDRVAFDDAATRFYCSCVVEAFSYLHSRAIVYRDLKPENLLLDQNGYVKLVDFGFAKKIGSGRKTWTFCGTPEYVAPEIILNKGHDVGADLWSLGILTFELLTGSPPFTSADPMKTYNLILKGIGSVDFPRKITKHAQSFIKKLCRCDPIDRLGYGPNGMREIHKHKWFDGYSWEALRRRAAKAPFVPKIKGPSDTSNFDTYPADEAGTPPDDNTGWDDKF